MKYTTAGTAKEINEVATEAASLDFGLVFLGFPWTAEGAAVVGAGVGRVGRVDEGVGEGVHGGNVVGAGVGVHGGNVVGAGVGVQGGNVVGAGVGVGVGTHGAVGAGVGGAGVQGGDGSGAEFAETATMRERAL